MSDSIKVLIVDDEDQFRATTKKILDRRGFVTILAANGEEAIAKIREKPDVVVLDVKMPGLDGLGTLAEIKSLAPDIPVIMLTGHGSEPSAKYAQNQGAFDYLAKPCDIDILTSKIKEALRPELNGAFGERTAGEVMIPIEEYTTLNAGATVKEAIKALHGSFQAKAATGRIMETGHRSILITDDTGEVIGILAITDLLDAIMPGYLKAPKTSTADSVRFSPMFWSGMFTAEIKDLGKKLLGEIMSPAPVQVEYGASLMEATFLLSSNQERRMVVVEAGHVVGVLREQELFFEMAAILH